MMQLQRPRAGTRAAWRRYGRRLRLLLAAAARDDWPDGRWQRYRTRLTERLGPAAALLGAALLLPLAGLCVGRLLNWYWEEHVRPDGPPRR